MSVTEQLMAQGDFRLNLTPDAPIDLLEEWGHVMVVPQIVDIDLYNDSALKTMSRFSGVVWETNEADEGYELFGPSLATYMGDNQGRGEIIKVNKVFNARTFVGTIQELLPAALDEGFIFSLPGTYDGEHFLETPLEAITYVCETFGAEWRVNPDGSVDAGLDSDLYVTVPTAIIVYKGGGFDPQLRSIPASRLATQVDAQDYITEVLVAGPGMGQDIILGEATAGSTPYKDFRGNALVRRVLVDEPETPVASADARAQAHLNELAVVVESVSFSAAEISTKGDFSVGDAVYVFAPPHIVDLSTVEFFEGDWINPATLRVVGMTWPITDGMGVLYRTADSTYVDLTEFVIWEDPDQLSVEVGALHRSPFDRDALRAVTKARTRTNLDDGTIPAVPPKRLPWHTYSYKDAEGRTRAAIIVEWSQPLNTDGSVIQDGSHYEIRFRRRG